MSRFFGRLFLWINRWKPEGELPTAPKYVLIASPHTSNWDMFYMLAISSSWRMKIQWMGKHTLFRFPMGWLMRWLGGIPIDRRSRHNVVSQIADRIREADEIIVVVPPEGTRGGGKYWKSGFYHIAKEAGVPIVMGYLDYERKRGGFGPPLYPTDDLSADMDRIREFYASIKGRYPGKTITPRLKEEDQPAADA